MLRSNEKALKKVVANQPFILSIVGSGNVIKYIEVGYFCWNVFHILCSFEFNQVQSTSPGPLPLSSNRSKYSHMITRNFGSIPASPPV
ncbi:hypothetical protein IEQ34_013029 [Dendrobium chrysotoxum]|uniref:Uncharacterized protein n=1 Tax=Dendrobium chrysotoxum TaxID=161865 RepID=A0AAV7GQJ2_DENCH|nr:hypothetical protein IEQ34_013029 [Dendrobium chrysotoxum]